MLSQKSKISLSFLPKKNGENILALDESSGTKFLCDEIVADFVDQALSVSLSGTFEGGARIRGVLRNNTESCFSILKFLEVELGERGKLTSQLGISKAIKVVQSELNKATNEVSQANQSLKDILKVYAEDFDWSKDVKKDYQSNNLFLRRNLRMFPKKNTKSVFYELPYSSISSFLSIETITESLTSHSLQNKALHERVQFVENDPYVQSVHGKPYLAIDIKLREYSELPDLLCFFRFKEIGGSWKDFEGKVIQIKDSEKIIFSLANFPSGKYEVTAYLKSFYTNEIIWKNLEGLNYNFDFVNSYSERYAKSITKKEEFKDISYNSFDSFSKWCTRHLNKREFGKKFFLLLSLLSQDDQSKVFEYYHEALRRISKRNSPKAVAILKAFRLLGASHVMMITPEGPHAMAGGLSQVISGLSAALVKEDCFVTIISPLYSLNNGNHHRSAKEIISEGLDIFGTKVSLTNLGAFNLKSHDPDLEIESWRSVEVYEAKLEKLRFIFVHNPQFTDRLYGGVSGQDAIQRSVFLCRSSLEILGMKEYNCKPDVIITHDWTTGIFRPLQKSEIFSTLNLEIDIPVLHLLHNAGPAYQGRFNLFESGKNIWNITGLSETYLEGFLESGNAQMINLTKGACLHNDHGILTVSKPYASHLAYSNDDPQLSAILRSKKEIIFGISNGIPTKTVKNAAFGSEKNKNNINEINKDELLILKREKKKEIQMRYGLPVDDSVVLAVLVGRLTDQKGLSLLTEVQDTKRTVLEEMILGEVPVQIIIAGPPAKGDKAFEGLEKLINSLSQSMLKNIKVVFEFLPHSEALKLTAAADIFLMPSRYEPGGIAQLEALAVGTSVVAHRVGGLSATLTQYQKISRRPSGNSFLFDSFSGEMFLCAFRSGCEIMGDYKLREQVVINAFKSKNDWRDRVPYYLTLFQKVIGVPEGFKDEIRYWASREDLLSKVSVLAK